MSNIKRYRVEHDWNTSMSVDLEVDFDILTERVASEINHFWGDADGRLSTAGNHQGAAVRFFGARTINTMLGEGGSTFGVGNPVAQAWSVQLRGEEGWGGESSDPLFGWCGIRIVAAEVENVSFYELRVKELA